MNQMNQFQQFNQFNQMPFNPMNQMNNQQKYLNIYFSCIGRTIIIQGESNMKFSDLASRFCTKSGFSAADQPKFILNSQQLGLDEPRTLAELNLRDNARIEVVLLKDVIAA